MFIRNLNKIQQAVLLDLCEQIIVLDDDRIDSIEKDMLDTIRFQCDHGVVKYRVDKSEIASIFDTSLSKYSLLLELLGIACSNNDYHSNQSDFIREYAQLLGVDAPKLIILEYWVKEQFLLVEKINLLISNDEFSKD